jgi:hypothetical protein
MKVSVRKLRPCLCGAPSLTRGRVCNLQCNHSMVRVAQNPKPYITVSSETPATWRASSPYLYPPGAGWPSYTPRHWVSSTSSNSRLNLKAFIWFYSPDIGLIANSRCVRIVVALRMRGQALDQMQQGAVTDPCHSCRPRWLQCTLFRPLTPEPRRHVKSLGSQPARSVLVTLVIWRSGIQMMWVLIRLRNVSIVG